MNRWPGILAVVLALVCIAVGLRSCGDAASDPDATHAASIPGTADTSTDNDASGAAVAAQRALVERRNDAMRQAVSTLHAYLAALGGDDRAKADAYWAGGKPPARTGEADLRMLEKLRALRIENGTPTPLDSESVPNALEIPVELRASIEGAPTRRYQGRYRLRRAVSGGGWEITSAAVDASPLRR